MELSSNNLFGFVLRRYKQKKNRTKEEENYKFQISSKNISPKKEQEKIDNKEIINYFHTLIINNSNISYILYNSIDPLVNECFNNLEFLSITNNYIRNIDFILKLPNLFFLDLFGNPLEELTALNERNIFGYLRLSVEFYNEKKILSIHDLYCGIFDIELKDKNKIKLFSNNNHHICMINNEINLMIDKIKYEESRKKLFHKKRVRRSDLSLVSYTSNSNAELNKSDTIDANFNKLIKNITNGGQDKLDEHIPVKIGGVFKPKNPFLIKIKKYFDEYQNKLNKCIQNEYKINNNSLKRNVYLRINDIFSSKNLLHDILYLEHERNKLIMIFDIYKKISVFNRDKKDNKYYVGNIYNLDENKNIDEIFVKEIKNNIMNKSQIPRASIIILISILFYTIGIISEKMMSALINYILTKYYDYDENQKFPDFSNMGNIHYLTFYYSTYDYIYKRMIDNEKNVSITKYKGILRILQMEKLVLKSNYLYKKLNESKLEDNNKNKYCEQKKIKITNEINSIKELDITKEFLVLIEFLCDYIIYEKIEDVLINNSYIGEYSYLVELKETIEETEFQMNNSAFINSSSLSVLKFQKNRKERLYNRFYFEEDKIKQIKNKDFKNIVLYDLNKSRTMNNFSTAIGNNNNNSVFNSTQLNFINANNINDINNEEKEYNKNDDIDIDEFFYIDSMIRKSSNKLNGRKMNSNNSFSKLKEKDSNFYLNDNSLEDENINTSSIKLPQLYYNQQPYEEFEFLKKMIFDPDFLSQHARNVIKFEKQKKRLQKKFINKSHKKIGENYYEESKPNEKKGSSCNYENNLQNKKNSYNSTRTKNNTNFEQNEKYMTFNNKKIVYNQTNSSNVMKIRSPNNYKIYNKINLKTIIDNSKEKKINKIMELNNKEPILNDKKCSRMKKEYKTPFFETPESFPGITLLKFGLKKNKLNLKKIKALNKKSPIRKEIEDDNKNATYKQKVMTKIRQTIKDNILRNARRVVCPIIQKNY
jgi:hypothetical protein